MLFRSGDQLLAQIRPLGLYEGEVALQAAAPTRILFAGADSERTGELLPGKPFGLEPDLECLRGGDRKIFGLLRDSLGQAGIGLRAIDKIEAEDILSATRSDVKAVTVVSRIRKVTAIL